MSQLKTEQPEHSEICEPTSFADAHILVVDDDRITQRIVKKFLSSIGVTPRFAGSAREARETVEVETPELVLCDINMPEEDGISFCRKFRANSATSEVPIIFFTGCKDSDTISRAFEAGASDYVIKPIRKEELISRCKRQVLEYRQKVSDRAQIQKLDKQNTSKTRFLSVASHDLRNPIASIRGISQFLVSEKFGDLNDGQKEMVQTIIEASEGMLDLVEDLLDVSKIELDQFNPQMQSGSPAEIMEQVNKLQAPAAQKKGIVLEHTDESQGALALVDARFLKRAIENLVTNALKFSPRETSVKLETKLEGGWISLSVIDGGPGIPEGEFDKLFKEFSRTSNMPTGGESTSGIGLYVVKGIVTSHGGEISVDNRPEGGAHFKIKLKRI